MKDFKHKTLLQLRFKDTDAVGHINNACHLTFFELGRMVYFEHVLGKGLHTNKTGMIVARATVDYIKPILLEYTVHIHNACTRVGNKSFEIHHSIVHTLPDGSETELATGQVIIVTYDYTKQISVSVPDAWRDAFNRFENLAVPR